ncbi:hypothetical protein JOQ06_013259 [Pogonophryne albipinna]|uniref:Uncharacterized protein n=1 Tax=Pogonophryne albipinna TaxID=1090488 RepID=A0AAD6FR60_9TELE|nr:hypothetical protein JOQ06_013259 [Pogonophryne albipinna]
MVNPLSKESIGGRNLTGHCEAALLSDSLAEGDVGCWKLLCPALLHGEGSLRCPSVRPGVSQQSVRRGALLSSAVASQVRLLWGETREGRDSAACGHPAKVNPPETSSPCVSTAYLLRLPARGASVCCGVTKRPLMLQMQESDLRSLRGPRVSLGTGSSERARLPPFYHREITGALSLLLPTNPALRER